MRRSIAGGTWLLALVGSLTALPGAAFAAGGGMPPLVQDIGISLLLSGLLAILFSRIRFPAIAGYILAGVIVGPLGLKLVTDAANIDTIAQLGFVLLLFMIGLELDLGAILKSGRTIAVGGMLTPPLIFLFGFVVAKALALVGFAALFPDSLAAMYFGLTIAFSSTLLVVKLYQAAFELDTAPGRVSLGLLVFEDIWAIIVILVQPNLQSPAFGAILGSFAGILVVALVTLLIARLVTPIIFRWIAKLPEVILVGAISWCFAVVFLGTSLDALTQLFVGHDFHLAVSPGMGALIAGAAIASLPYSHEIVSKVGIVRDFFITLFFVGLGLSLPVPSGWAVPALAVLLAIGAILTRQIVLFPILYFSGLDRRNAQVIALRMSQISEFSLVIAFLGVQFGHLSSELGSAIIFAFVITALTTKPLYDNAYRLQDRLAPLLRRLGFRDPPAQAAASAHEVRLALLGFHRVASSLLHDLTRSDPELVRHTLVVDFNVALHPQIRSLGAHVHYGDLANPDTLLHAGVDRAAVIVSTVPDDLMRGTSNRRLVGAVRRLNPHAVIIANAVELDECPEIYAAGADFVYLQRIEAARGLSEAVSNALAGDLAAHRARREAIDGRPEDRHEILR